MLSQIFMRHDFSHCFGFSEVLFLVKTALLEALFVDSPKNSNSNPQISQNGRKTTPKNPPPPDFRRKTTPKTPHPPDFQRGVFWKMGGFGGFVMGGFFKPPKTPQPPKNFWGVPQHSSDVHTKSYFYYGH